MEYTLNCLLSLFENILYQRPVCFTKPQTSASRLLGNQMIMQIARGKIDPREETGKKEKFCRFS